MAAESTEVSKARGKIGNKMLKGGSKVTKSAFVVAQDIKLAKVLAGNNKKLRERALKRLKKWFLFRSQSMPFTEEDFMRIWKGLFYTLWMSDKPLVQEECVESIADLVHHPSVTTSLLFFKCGLKTLGNEWFGIDQLRLEKFLMFVRRLLRQGLTILKNSSWDVKVIRAYNDILSATVLNIESSPPGGLVMHFIEIYLEELAKVSKGELKHHLLIEFLKPFVKHLSLSKDSRHITCIKRHIFRYLLKQSDAGIEYEEKFKAWKMAGFPGGSVDAMQKQKLPDEERMSDDEDSRGMQCKDTPLDPRAGHVDVELPQLKFSSKQIVNLLAQNKFVDGSSIMSRKAIATLIDEFTHMSKGRYPLGLKKIELPKDDGYSLNTKKSVNRLVKFENKLMGKTKKKRKLKAEDDLGASSAKRKKTKKSEDTADDRSDVLPENNSYEDFDTQLKNFIEKSEGHHLKNNRNSTDKKQKKKEEKLEKNEGNKSKRKNEINRSEGKNKTNKRENFVLEKKLTNKTRGERGTRKHKENIAETNEIKFSTEKSNTQKDKAKLKKAKRKRRLQETEQTESLNDGFMGGTYECSFRRNSGTWFVHAGDDDSFSESSFGSLSLISENEGNASGNKSLPKFSDITTSPNRKAEAVSLNSKHSELSKPLHIHNLQRNGSWSPEDIGMEPANVKVVSEAEQTYHSTPAKEFTKINEKFSPKLTTKQLDMSPRPTKAKQLNCSHKKVDIQSEATLTLSSPLGNTQITNELFTQSEWDIPLKDGEVEIFIPSNKFKGKTDASPDLKKIKGKSRSSLGNYLVKNPFSPKKTPSKTPGSSKKVKIDLKLNKSQEVHEHVAQIKSSPGIPFDANKKPAKPLLKTTSIGSPINPFYKRKLKL